ncbi:S8 family serine peptidase [Maribellus comscasis]|uniref:S8 family serine peptidase n=1 Tax=Maribellus comscasis TaxID=2681766 RepID=A0A6I6JIF4_9BACT|nr:S8 family serine peptidase [Maribellus comscasis]QGY42635.1 S8 family serine peptidase [Maribellus comscasis]
MKKLLFKILGLVVLVSFFQSCKKSLVEDPVLEELELKSANTSKKSYIVVLNDVELNDELSKLKGYEKKQNAVQSAGSKILKRAGVLDAEIEHVYGTAVKGFSVKIPPGQLKKLQGDPSVSYVEEDKVISLVLPKAKPDKPGKPGGGNDGGGSTPQETPWGITRVNGGISVTGKTAWIIDSGIDQDHPDLNVDTGRSASFLTGKESNNPDDQNGHGTHVAGTVAAIDNDFGVVGVAAGAKVVSVRVLDRRGSGTTSGVVDGVDYVAANASSGDVANMSLGGGISSTLDAAVLAASSSCSFVLAAGNESEDADNHSPARVNGPNIYTVSAMWEGDRFATEFSNFGPAVDYAAPGVYILSTYKNGGYDELHGTSMASPHVAGILLLGSVKTSGYVTSDPDGNADPIASH